MAEQKRPSVWDGVTGKTTPGVRGAAQSPVSPVTEALFQSREYDKQATADKNRPTTSSAGPDGLSQIDKELGLAYEDHSEVGQYPMSRLDLRRAYDESDKAASVYVKAGIPEEELPFNIGLWLSLSEQAKERLAKGQVAPRHEAEVRRLAEYVPAIPEKFAGIAKKAGLAYKVDVPTVPRDPSPLQRVHIAADRAASDDYRTYRYPADPLDRVKRESNLPATQRALQRIAEATPPEPKKK